VLSKNNGQNFQTAYLLLLTFQVHVVLRFQHGPRLHTELLVPDNDVNYGPSLTSGSLLRRHNPFLCRIFAVSPLLTSASAFLYGGAENLVRTIAGCV